MRWSESASQRHADANPAKCGPRDATCGPGATFTPPRRSWPEGLLAFVRSALGQSVVDLLALGADRVLLGVAAGHPHLAAEGTDRGSHHLRLGDLVLVGVVGETLMIAVVRQVGADVALGKDLRAAHLTEFRRWIPAPRTPYGRAAAVPGCRPRPARAGPAPGNPKSRSAHVHRHVV